MHTLKNLSYSLLLFCSVFVIAPECAAQSLGCTPVVYAFRHAEDDNGPPPRLTAIGDQHADLYPDMIYNFQFAHGYCTVGFVYSMFDTNPNSSPGTNNPYETAAPLAVSSCYNLWSAITVEAGIFAPYPVDPDNCGTLSLLPPVTGGSFPQMALRSGGKLYEFLGTVTREQTNPETGKSPKAGPSATFEDLRAELLSNTSYVPQTQTVDAQRGLSSAIFWTSQGLNVLGQGIAQGFTGIPVDPKPPRNAVYVFEYQNGAFNPPTELNQYLQCFNVNSKNQAGGTTYYCPKGGNLPANIKDLPSLRGKICDTTKLGTDCIVVL